MKAAIIEKIKKLLSLANSENEHEAKLAAQKAAELLTRHNLTSVNLENGYERKDFGHNEYYSYDEQMIHTILNKFFFVYIGKVVWGPNNSHYFIMGTPSNVEIASYVHAFLRREFEIRWRMFKVDHPYADRKSYYYGLMIGMQEQLEATKKRVENDTGLMVVRDPALTAFMEKQFEGLGMHSNDHYLSHKDHHAAESGQQAGKEITIRRGMNTQAENNGRMLT